MASDHGEPEALRDEVERHRNANLLRSVLGGHDVLDEAVTNAINADDFDRVPWLVAERFRADAERLRAALVSIAEGACSEAEWSDALCTDENPGDPEEWCGTCTARAALTASREAQQ
jgi:hypothetical protein